MTPILAWYDATAQGTHRLNLFVAPDSHWMTPVRLAGLYCPDRLRHSFHKLESVETPTGLWFRLPMIDAKPEEATEGFAVAWVQAAFQDAARIPRAAGSSYIVGGHPIVVCLQSPPAHIPSEWRPVHPHLFG